MSRRRGLLRLLRRLGADVVVDNHQHEDGRAENVGRQRQLHVGDHCVR